MALVLEDKQKAKGPPLVLQVIALIVVTALAVGMGWVTGGYLEARQAPASEPGTIKEEEPAARGNDGPAGPVSVAAPAVIDLDPITTNLADPTEIWVRMELAAVFDGAPDPALARKVHQDILAYIRTVKLRQIESASGFQHLRADLRERARIRSEGRVDDILIRTFLYE
ncbi:flagellar basal body-associated FliL family protein [Nitratireductor sp. GCM10026969]|uniref:flagellar basal body-associated FliL family protein n=1 Tax=Nitratireductor sp. GCM10026969 TaxID=3252645 RepID=UPI00360A0EF4